MLRTTNQELDCLTAKQIARETEGRGEPDPQAEAASVYKRMAKLKKFPMP